MARCGVPGGFDQPQCTIEVDFPHSEPKIETIDRVWWIWEKIAIKIGLSSCLTWWNYCFLSIRNALSSMVNFREFIQWCIWIGRILRGFWLICVFFPDHEPLYFSSLLVHAQASIKFEHQHGFILSDCSIHTSHMKKICFVAQRMEFSHISAICFCRRSKFYPMRPDECIHQV